MQRSMNMFFKKRTKIFSIIRKQTGNHPRTYLHTQQLLVFTARFLHSKGEKSLQKNELLSPGCFSGLESQGCDQCSKSLTHNILSHTEPEILSRNYKKGEGGKHVEAMYLRLMRLTFALTRSFLHWGPFADLQENYFGIVNGILFFNLVEIYC